MLALIRQRIPHIMKTISKTTCPSNLLFFDTETRGKYYKDNPGCTFQYLWFGCAYACRYEEGRISREQSIFFAKAKVFWDFLLSRMDSNRPLYVFAHNLPFDLTICNFWEESKFNSAEVRFTIFEDPPTVISLSLQNKTLNFIDTLNYWRLSLKDIGESINLPKYEMPSYRASLKEWRDYCYRDVEILSKAVTKLMDFIRENNLGPFAFTQASQAMAAFKTRFLKHQIFIHDNYEVLSMERKAYHGGLVNNYFIGERNNKIYKLDVNSLYPSVMLNYFPVKLLDLRQDTKPSILRNWSRQFGLLAEVEICTKEECYPVKYNGKLIEANGVFESFLCGAELIRAINKGHIRSVIRIARYEMQPIFVDYINFFWNKRLEFRKPPKNEVYDTFCKLTMNSLYGKFGQRSYEWVDLTFDNLQVWYALNAIEFPKTYSERNYKPKNLFVSGEWFPLNSPYPIQIRKLGNIEQMRLPVDEHSMSCPIIAAYVTSYARERLRDLIRKAGKRNVYYTDTDSLFVNQKGYNNLLQWKEIDANTLGKLKIEETSNHSVFKCPKVYDFNGKQTIKGIRKDAIQIGENEYLQNQFEGLRTILNREPNPYIKIAWITKENKYTCDKVITTKSGWTKAITLQQPSLETSLKV